MDVKEMCIYLILFGLILLFRRVVYKKDLSSLGLTLNSKSINLFWEGAFTGVLYVIGYVVIILLFTRKHVIYGDLSSSALHLKTALIAWISFLPELLFTETLFRGHILQVSLTKFHPFVSVIITSIAYTICSLFFYTDAFHCVYAINCFLLSSILCLMAVLNSSLMSVLGKEAAFVVTQLLLFGSTNDLESLIGFNVDSNVLIGVPTNLKSSFALTIVLCVGLIIEIKHALHHFAYDRSSY